MNNFNLKHNFILDYSTLFLDHIEIYKLENALLTIPYSSLVAFNECVRTVASNPDIAQQELIKTTFNPFLNLIHSSSFKNGIEENRLSPSLCINTLNETFINIANVTRTPPNKQFEEIHKSCNVLDYDVLLTCYKLKLPLVTSNVALTNIIDSHKLDIDYIFLSDTNN